MAVKRKSNWYIYLIALIASFVLLGLFVQSIWDSLFPADDNGSRYALSRSDYRPSAEINITSLLMLSDMKAATPTYYMLMNYQPRNEVIVFIPLRENTRVSYGGNTGSIYEMYDNFGAKAAADAVAALMNIEIEHYVKFDRLSFIDFVDMGGKVYVNIPSDVTVKETKQVLKNVTIEVDGEEEEVTRLVPETTETVIFPEGIQFMNGESLYGYLTYDFKRGVDYTLAVQGSAAMNMINKNFRGMSSTQMQGLAESIIKTTETDIIFDDYTNIQAIFNYTLENSINPCEYYIPYGETDGGYFVISDGSISTMRDRMGITAKKD
ncbi:MAG: LCP family protein [Ruminiclostridium sp.]|nr:LCP family protein [Ruminiclostridium sp.]